MKEKKFSNRVLSAATLSAKGKIARALTIFAKLRKNADTPYKTAFLDYYEAKSEMQHNNFEKAAAMLNSCAEYFYSSDHRNMACTSYLMLGNALDSLKKYDEASHAYLKAETLTENSMLLCEIKTLCAEARMKSDTVYDTELFTEPCEFIQQLINDDKPVSTEHFIRSCLIAAQASFAANKLLECAQFCLLGMEASITEKKYQSSPFAFECVVIICKSAVLTWNNSIIESTADRACSFIHDNFPDVPDSHWIRLLHTLTLIRRNDKKNAQLELLSLDRKELSEQNILFFDYCSELCNNNVYNPDNACIPKDNIDELFLLAESIIDRGFTELAAEIYKYSLSIYSDHRPLILRPLASLLYRLEEYEESAQYYSELITEDSDSILHRAYALASHRSYDSETAQQQMHRYVETSKDRESALTMAALLSMDEGFSPEFSASLYEQLTDLLEQDKAFTQEIVDAYNRLGICLYRSGAPLETEMNAFKKAISHAEACETARNTNIHAVIICNLAECYMRDGKVDLCYDTFKRADAIFSALDDLDLIQYSTCLKFIADILITRDDKEGAVEILKKAINLLEPHADDDPSVARQLSLCRNALGTVYFKLGKPELEIPELTKAIDLVRENPIDNSSLALLYSNRGEAYERIGKYDCMAEDYAISLSLSESDNESDSENQISKAAKWLSIGRYREDSMLHDKAISAYKTALDLLSSLTSSDEPEAKELAAFAYYQLGNAYCHHSIKNFSAGLAAYTRSLNILESLPSCPSSKMHLASTYDARASFYEVFGEHSLAVADYKRAEELRADILS